MCNTANTVSGGVRSWIATGRRGLILNYSGSIFLRSTSKVAKLIGHFTSRMMDSGPLENYIAILREDNRAIHTNKEKKG